MSEFALEVSGLGKRYRVGGAPHTDLRDWIRNAVTRPWALARRAPRGESFWALRDVSFDVRPGEVVGVVGANGAGKSTLLKILSEITEPTRGHADIRGRVGCLLEVGAGFHPELTGRENVYLSASILGMRRHEIQQRFDEIIAFAEISRFIDTPVKRYSSGMYLRLAFSVAAHLETEILIVDEILAVGDAAFQRKCIQKMADVSSSGRTVLFVSHNAGAVRQLCSRGLWLREGELALDASADEAVAAYLGELDERAGRDLSQRNDRSGRGQSRLVGLRIHSAGRETEKVAVGDDVRIEFEVSRTLPDLSCWFAVQDAQGAVVASFPSESLPEGAASESHAVFTCELPKLLLRPGRYRVPVILRAGPEVQDRIESAAVFEVIDGAVDGVPVTANGDPGTVHLPHAWIVPPAD